MSKHTPGPWFADGVRFVRQLNGPRHVICRLPTQFNPSDQALIAAAPELLEALKAAIDCGMVPITSASEGGASKHSRQVQVADTIRAAIAKAEGTA